MGSDPVAGREFPDARTLDAAVPGRPAIARRVDGHALWVNSAALSAAGIATRDPRSRGRTHPPAAGRLAVGSARRQRDGARRPRRAGGDGRGPERWLREGAAACARAGLTEIQDASGYDAVGIAALQRLASRGELPIRVYADRLA